MSEILKVAIDPGLAHTAIVACTTERILEPEYYETISTPASHGIDAMHDRVGTIADLLHLCVGEIKSTVPIKQTQCIVLTTLFMGKSKGKTISNKNSDGAHKAMGVAVGVASVCFSSYDIIRDQVIVKALRERGYAVPRSVNGKKKVKTPFVKECGWEDCPNGHVADAWLAVLYATMLLPHQLKEMKH